MNAIEIAYVNALLADASYFDAVVWRIKAGSELAGVNGENASNDFVSMRGTMNALFELT